MSKQNKSNKADWRVPSAAQDAEDGSGTEIIIQGLLSLSEASSQDRRKEPSCYPVSTAPGQLPGLSLGRGSRRDEVIF